MILIADAGSTKTDWSLMDEELKLRFFQTQGYNPYFNDMDTIVNGLKDSLPEGIDYKAIKEVFYYGAGCSNDKNCGIISQSLNSIFPGSQLFVSDDLTGAARSLFGKSEGIACILGTGSNSGYYNGIKIIERLPSLGYMFGDEGSGAHMGKMLITDFLYETIPQEIKTAFDKKYNYSLANILEGVYKNPYPNRFLASFTTFLSEHISSDYIRKLVKSSFSAYFKNQLQKFSAFGKVEIAVVGSVGYIFKDFFQNIADENNVIVKRFLKSPARGLIRYHCGIELE